jgi:4-amino-4-deoxy-L-arabinose transferase-like glycosyltransferase
MSRWLSAVNSSSRASFGGFTAAFLAAVQHRYFVATCLVIAFILRVCWIFWVEAQPVSDFRWYYERGLDFAAGQGYSIGPGAYWPENIPPRALDAAGKTGAGRSPTAYWPVGYPAFLGLLFSLFGPSLLVAKLANVLLYLGILFLAYFIANTLFASALTGRITLLGLTFYPDHLAYTSLISSEILFLFLLLAGVSLLLISRASVALALVAGFVFGLAILIKPQAVFVPAIFYGLAMIESKGALKCLKMAFAVHLALGLTILPWLMRNYQDFNTLTLSHNNGYNLLVGNNPYATGSYVFNNQITAMLKDAQTEPERDKKALQLALNYVLNHPLDTLKLWPKKLWYLYQDDTKGIVWNERGLENVSPRPSRRFFTILRLVAQLYYLLIGIGFFLALLVLPRLRKNNINRRPLSALGLGIIFYFTLIVLITFGNSRFHFVMIPWMVIYIGVLIDALVRSEQQKQLPVSQPTRRFMWN